MGRLLKYLFFLLLVALLAVAAYALFFELPAPQQDMVAPVEIDIAQ